MYKRKKRKKKYKDLWCNFALIIRRVRKISTLNCEKKITDFDKTFLTKNLKSLII
jgi:uncharacterized protein YlbG (UPF0298 family)